MNLRIFVEDKISKPYEVLAWKVLDCLSIPPADCKVKASRLDLVDFTTVRSLLENVEAAKGYDTVFFILDQEGSMSTDRPAKLKDFRKAFLQLCDHLQRSREASLSRVRVVRIVSKSCLESWLASDPQAIVDSARGKHGITYRPNPVNTDELSPKQALSLISHILQETGGKLKKKPLQRIGEQALKSRGADIASHLDPRQACKFNSSFKYFFDMLAKPGKGCSHLQKE